MEKQKTQLKYRGKKGEIETMMATVHTFSSIQEAIDKLGEDVVLNHVNYSYGLLERQKLITIARGGK
jgi:hypothetical protein